MLTQDEIIQMARDAGLDWHAGFSVGDDEENRYECLIRMAYAAGHKDGQREMREQAAVTSWSNGMACHKGCDDTRELGSLIARAIRQLEIREPS